MLGDNQCCLSDEHEGQCKPGEMIEVEYRAETSPGFRAFGVRWRATCPTVPGFRTRIEMKLRDARASAIHELGKQAVDPETVVRHVLVDTDDERYALGNP